MSDIKLGTCGHSSVLHPEKESCSNWVAANPPKPAMAAQTVEGPEPKKILTRADIAKMTEGFHRCGWDVGPVKNPNPECGCMCGTVYNAEGEPIIGHYGRHSGVRCKHADDRGRLRVIGRYGQPPKAMNTTEAPREVDCCKGSAPSHECYINCGGTKPNPSPSISQKVGSWPSPCLQRAFVEGAKWWQFHKLGSTAFPSEIDIAEEEAVLRYGEPEESK